MLNPTIFTEAELAQMSDDWLQYSIEIASRNVDLLEEDGLMDAARLNEQAHDELIEELERRNAR